MGATMITEGHRPPSPLGMAQSLSVGVIMSATDSVATLALIDSETQPMLHSILFGESVVNDATAIVLFHAVRKYAGKGFLSSQTGLGITFDFIFLFTTSIMLGLVVGFMSVALARRLQLSDTSITREVALHMCLAYGGYVQAQVLELSGIVTVFATGMVLSIFQEGKPGNLETARNATANTIKVASGVGFGGDVRVLLHRPLGLQLCCAIQYCVAHYLHTGPVLCESCCCRPGVLLYKSVLSVWTEQESSNHNLVRWFGSGRRLFCSRPTAKRVAQEATSHASTDDCPLHNRSSRGPGQVCLSRVANVQRSESSRHAFTTSCIFTCPTPRPSQSHGVQSGASVRAIGSRILGLEQRRPLAVQSSAFCTRRSPPRVHPARRLVRGPCPTSRHAPPAARAAARAGRPDAGARPRASVPLDVLLPLLLAGAPRTKGGRRPERECAELWSAPQASRRPHGSADPHREGTAARRPRNAPKDPKKS
eukprot:scaffold1603_cov415-Prasinococcus_capsulatus_cf.AAC.21